MIAHARQVLNATTTDHHHRVFLQLVAHTGDVSRNFHAVGQANPSDLADSGVRLLGGSRLNHCANSALEGRRVIDRPVLKSIVATRQSHRASLAPNYPPA